MIETKSFVKTLITLPGLSGYEGPVSAVVADAWRPLVHDLSTSKLGSLHGFRKGAAPEPRPGILLMAHMDAIGMMVTRIVDGFIYFTGIGGIDIRILPGQIVTVHGRRDLPGVVVMPPAPLLPPGSGDKPVEMEHLMVDVGLSPADVTGLIRPGDLISFAQPPLELTGDTLAGHSMDNRVSVAAVTICLQELAQTAHAWDVWAVASVQEEVTLGGAKTSPFEIRPDLAVVVDVTFAKGPGVSNYRGFPLGKGVTLAIGPNIHPALHKAFKELAEKLDIPHVVEAAPRMSGTDAMGIQVVAEGIPCLVLGIPLRYMHTPVETVSLKDIERAGHLMAEFIAHLEPDFMKNISWED
jgi:tetrahedral aminopeptidase